MSYQNQPKSIDDYKDVVKILKLKIIKQNKKIQELELKNKVFEDQINSVTLKGEEWQVTSRAMLQLQNEANNKKQVRELQLSTLKGKVDVMNAFVKGLKKVGITPQSVFRVADRQYTGFVEADHFRQILSKMNLGLSQKQISCLIFIFDEFYTGIIAQADYYCTLHAYKVGSEQDNNQFIQQSLFRLSQMLHNDRIILTKFYEEMQGRSKRTIQNTNKKLVDLNIFEDHIKRTYNVASFNAIDLETQGYLQKNNFLYCVTACINRLLSGDDGVSKKTNEWKNDKSQLSHKQKEKQRGSPNKSINNMTNYNQNSKINIQPPVINPASTTKQVFKEGILSKLGDINVSLQQIYELVLFDKFQHRLTARAFKRCCASNNKLTPQIISQLFRLIDSQIKGSVYFNELINFYLANSSDNQMILRLFGKYFSCNDLDAEKFWFMFGMNAETELSKNKFLQLMKKSFETKQEKLWQNFWGMFDKGRGSANVGNIIKMLKKYQIE